MINEIKKGKNGLKKIHNSNEVKCNGKKLQKIRQKHMSDVTKRQECVTIQILYTV